MDSSCGIRRLQNLAQQLRSYKPPLPQDNDTKEEEVKKGAENLGFSEPTDLFRRRLSNFGSKRAAVLVCLFEGDAGDLRVILTKRAPKLSSHAGEVSLPGGKVDKSDADECETALREAKEEIGLDPLTVKVVTVLEPFFTMQFTRVIPVVGMLFNKRAFEPVINSTEVEAVFDVPLEMFLKDENHWTEEVKWMGVVYHLPYFRFQAENKKYVIWGLTAGILTRVASVVYQRPPPFDEQRSGFKIRNL
ncbi:nudix hydrolase 15, mitochondrial-like isoform X1 [Magnolia sinica]|uniref:nudix hydrolase 15, mitochondrial-like isoform X1 n=1 Tax=Magnolia sinica TaxID=86752 RepID=UPI00265A8BF3|nr:nudix hydrolase 15, mitochondrial-like isoform X1 [Magnolia sinica]